jgi:hypothetical protein
MSRIPAHELLLRNLARKYSKDHRLYMPREEAYEELKKHTLQDFGYRAWRWRLWFRGKTMTEAMPAIFHNPILIKDREVLLGRTETAILLGAIRHPNEGNLFLVPEVVLEELKRRSGQDFSYDADAWET